MLSATDAAYEAIWRFIFGIDLIGRIEVWRRPPDDALPWMLTDWRRLQRSTRDALWLRVVDVPTALEGRRYGREGALTLRIVDDFCPWNDGGYRLEGSPDGAECRKVDGSPDLVMDARDLGALYLGGASAGTLARAGRVREETAGALRMADNLFRAELAPWAPFLF
ncbi:MAG: GNAT family N-acetyltransferase, partial [Dehalococcoidia bacterium]|nr:GNAT family N-acetyltransferase [Dehalococcoidia bacterium]